MAPAAPMLVKDGKVVIAPCVFSVTVAAVPLTLPVTLAVILPVDFNVPVTLRFPPISTLLLSEVSLTTRKSPPKDTSISTNNIYTIFC